jgi:excisionase family DNA binding protein
MKKSKRAPALPAEPLLTYQELAQELNISERHLRDLVYSGVVGCYRLGYKTVRFHRSRVLRDLLRREVKAIGT